MRSVTLNYEWAISDDHQVCNAYERYRDSAAFMTHLESFGPNFAVRLMEAVTPARLVVYGTPSPQVNDALAGLTPVYMAPLGGFIRYRFRFGTFSQQYSKTPIWK